MVNAAPAPHVPHQWTHRPQGTPVLALASTTTVVTLDLGVDARAVLLTLVGFANLTSMAVTGSGSGASYATLAAAPNGPFVLIGVAPAIDDHLSVSLVVGAGGPVFCYAAILTDPNELIYALPSLTGGNLVTLDAPQTAPAALNGNLTPPTAYPFAALNFVFAPGANVWAPVECGNSMSDGDSGFSSQRGLNQVWNGASWDKLRTPSVFKPQATVAIGAETTIWTPASGKKFRLMGMAVVDSAATTITFRDNTAGTTIFVLDSAAAGAPSVVSLGNGILSAAANNVLTAQGGAAGNLIGTVWGTEE